MDDQQSSAPEPLNDQGSSVPSGDQPSPDMTPFHGNSSSWKTTLVVGLAVAVLVGGGLTFYFSQSDDARTQVAETPDTETSLDYYASSDDEWTDEEWDAFWEEIYSEDYTDDYTDYYGDYYYTLDDYSTEVSSTEGYMTFIDYNYQFKIDYPEDWYLEPSWSVTFFSSDYEDYEDYLLENVSVATEDVSYLPDLTLEEYAEASLVYLVDDPYYTYASEGYRSFGAYDAMYIEGLYDIGYGEEAGVLSLFAINDGTVYLLTYMYELPEKEIYYDIIEHMIGSFELLGDVATTHSGDAEPEVDFGFASLLHLKK